MITISLPVEDIQELGRSVNNVSRETASISSYLLIYGNGKQYGKMYKCARFALSYGSSYKTASHVSGLGLRRIKVIAKQLGGL